MMLDIITNDIIYISINWFIPISLGMLLSFGGYFVSVVIHELGHWMVTVYYGKPLKYSCKIKLLGLSKDFKPHTESEYYTYLELNRSDINIQRIIHKIAIAGYISGFIWLFLCLLAITIGLYISKLKFFMFACLFMFLIIVLEIKNYLHSSDRQIIKNPANFHYKYKQ